MPKTKLEKIQEVADLFAKDVDDDLIEKFFERIRFTSRLNRTFDDVSEEIGKQLYPEIVAGYFQDGTPIADILSFCDDKELDQYIEAQKGDEAEQLESALDFLGIERVQEVIHEWRKIHEVGY